MISLLSRILPLLVTLVSLSEQRLEDTDVQVLYRWKFPNWLYANNELRLAAEHQGQYVPSNGAIIDSDFYFTHTTSLRRVFVSTPQFRSGIPATLSEVTRFHRNGSYLLRPFPDWDAQNRSSCAGPVSVDRFHIDKCGVLWALDTGLVDMLTSSARRACPPKLVLYDLNNADAVLLRYEFPANVITERSNLVNIITETYRSDCRDSIAYIADTNAYGLLVFDLARKSSWRINNPYFHPFPHQATVTSNNVTFELMHGIFALALSSPHDTVRRLYFHSFASAREAWIPVFLLRNASLSSNQKELRKFMTISAEARTSQSTLEVMTEDGVLLYALLGRNAIACWNSKTRFVPENHYIIYEDNENLQYISGMKLKGKQLLLTSSRLQNYINGDLRRADVKYRIILIDDVNQLLVNTPCMRKAVTTTRSPNLNLTHLNSTSRPTFGGGVTTPPAVDGVKPQQDALVRLQTSNNSTSTAPPTSTTHVPDDCDEC